MGGEEKTRQTVQPLEWRTGVEHPHRHDRRRNVGNAAVGGAKPPRIHTFLPMRAMRPMFRGVSRIVIACRGHRDLGILRPASPRRGGRACRRGWNAS